MASQSQNPYKARVDGQARHSVTSYFDQVNSSTQKRNALAQLPSARSSAASLETARATPPVNIPNSSETAIVSGDSPPNDDNESFMEHYMRNRKPSITFDSEVRTDFGHRQSIDKPLPKGRDSVRGRSILHELAEERLKQTRSHSENTVDHYDPITGLHRPQFSTTPPREEAHVGEARFPILQNTVDEMARESHLKLTTHPMSLTSQSTMSPKSEEVHTPQDDEPQYALSPLPASPQPRNISTSYESSAPRPFRRTASQRWRDGEGAQDFFSRAGSLRNRNKEGSSYRSSSRRETASSGNGNSVASSFLRGFSVRSDDGESSGSAAVDAEGQTIGEDYVIGKQIGFGGFSVIKEVTQLSAETGKQRKLAVKIVRRNIEGKSETENDTAQADFDHEVELWRFLNHPNILPLEAVYKLDEATFCFIPLNTGGTLFDLIRSNRQGLDMDLARNYSYQLASALRYLHLDSRIAHRDVKLENCLVDTTDGKPGVIRLCDFGMADWLDNDHEVNSPDSSSGSGDRTSQRMIGPADTSTSAFAGGSLEYAPPEIVRIASSTSLAALSGTSGMGINSPSGMQRKRISPSVDIWAFGVCLYTMITGKRPFSDSFMPRIVMAILAGDWDRELLADKADNDDDLVTLIEGCLAMNEKRRWDIRAVMECDWFEEERENESSAADRDTRSGGWRL